MEVTIAALNQCKTQTREDYVLKSSRGTSVMSFDTAEKAIKWQSEQKKKHGDRAPNLKLFHVITIQKEI
ncbi:hypothetical protein KMC60_gp13 [Achromobacter phage vB_AxyP_19-32_Axy11]|uniref:Uncharacterized protein n=3 Tax=Pourcelvirus TaxID=2842976 RepID=A0A514CW13_9CAUD|nr:hypothetical protein KMC59_gp13 [Achromobacter phage vB_AxyP_19-32_Axy10]YP_010079384.1 hypothetical protein KMC60_gp13 [Achromobacter phage vB_AxyP_19-32_Axy11]QDH83984.1 hypothetical protein Axy10_013 [Achromobacter phage vB_AxyP_19-32_Axy10]QDH84065.1 hypothetical protein Axy11_013 [Achromobacter phage vB_AxyP_19-32_Axy11]QDH84658.1 hypothetical protein Axy22_012 [Achromobacter phage vB_AxyP_19-32_Axy22]